MEPRISIITLGVSDMQRSWKFYHDALGLPTANKSTDAIVYFNLRGTVLGLYPKEKLAQDLGVELPSDPLHQGSTQLEFLGSIPEDNPQQEFREPRRFSGVTIAHNTRTKEEVDQILEEAEKAGGKIEKPAQATFWGGYSGYFSDPDGHLWEVAYADSWDFNPDGSLVL